MAFKFVVWITFMAFLPAQAVARGCFQSVCPMPDYVNIFSGLSSADRNSEIKAIIANGKLNSVGECGNQAIHWVAAFEHNSERILAELLNINALMYLGMMHRDGLGFQSNNETAYFWFTVAGKLKKTFSTGDMEPEEFASGVSAQLSPPTLTKLSQDSDRWIIEHPETPPQSIPPC